MPDWSRGHARWRARAKSRTRRRSSTAIGDLFETDLSAATVVTLYLSPSMNRELEAKLKRERKPGTRIVSHQFPIGRWAPERALRASDGTELYLWVIRSTPLQLP